MLSPVRVGGPKPVFMLALRLPLPLNPAGALEPAFALGRGLKAACVLGAELAVFELDAVLALPVELDGALAPPVPLDAALVLPLELDAAFALPVAARPEEPELCALPAVGEGVWLANWGGGLGGGAGAAVVASSMAANGWPSVCCA